MSTFLHYVHCKDALLDCSTPGGERCESLTWVDEIALMWWESIDDCRISTTTCQYLEQCTWSFPGRFLEQMHLNFERKCITCLHSLGCCWLLLKMMVSLQWRHNGHDGVSNHQLHDCLLNLLFWCRSKKTSKLRVAGLCVGNSPMTGEFPAHRASSAESVSIWWRHHVFSPKVINPQLTLWRPNSLSPIKSVWSSAELYIQAISSPSSL